MNHFQSYFTTSIKIINIYKNEIPLAGFLKKYFSQNKKYGSKDRKIISHFCYCYYRLGYAFKNLFIEERLKIAIFLCSDKSEELSVLFEENWLNNWVDNLQCKIKFIQSLHAEFKLQNIFPWKSELSGTIDTTAFAESYLIQPNLFLRIRPGKKEQVKIKLHENKVAFEELNENCIALLNSTKIASILKVNDEVVIQDYSSQQIQNFFPLTIHHQPSTVWDCCAGSGGKSILAFDVLQNIQLTASDLRPAIILNLKKRFAEAGIKKYNTFIADLASSTFSAQFSFFDVIICDAPCTGSGTWSRTPEQLYFFKDEKINYYSSLQKEIISSVIARLKPNGYFLYITCSVFKKENEEIVAFIQQKFRLQLMKMDLIKGYTIRADTLFAALFRN